MEQDFKVVYARITPKEHMDFRMHCVKHNLSMNKIVADLLRKYLSNNLKKDVDLVC